VGIIIALQGKVEEGIPIMEQSLTLYKSLGDKLGQANALTWLSLNHNDLEHSKSLLFESLPLYRELGDRTGIANSLSLLAQQAIYGGDFSSALRWAEDAMAIYHELGSQSGEADVLNHLGHIFYWQGNYQQAYIHFKESIALNEKVGVSWFLWGQVGLAYTFLRQGNITQAKESFEFSIRQFQKADYIVGLVYAIEGVASLCNTQGQPERAAWLFAWADAMRDQMGDHRPPIEQASVEKDLAVIHSKIDDIAFTRLSVEGRTMTTEQAIVLALEE
jgi:tetratricopeptide (TPR) repeat protein